MTVAASLIVKNEGLVIARCLNSLRGLVDAVVIVDTGSTDDTLEVIRGLEFPVPIHLHQRSWKNFAHNRTESLRLAGPIADYLLLLDADYTVEGHLPELTADAYHLLVRTSAIEYPKLLLIRSAMPWRYEGVVHEYLVCEQAAPPEYIDTLIIHDHVDGGRRPPGWQPRWEWDAEVLEQELIRDPSNTRNVFYLARSYDDLASTRPDEPRAEQWRQNAMARYRERAQMAGYADEAFYSLLRLGTMRLTEGDGLSILLEAWERCPHRWEPVHEAVRWLNQQRRFQASYALSKRTLANPVEPSGLFVHRAVFDYLLLFEHSISAYWVGYYQECWDACQTLLGLPLPGNIEEAVRRNREFARQRLDEQAREANRSILLTARPAVQNRSALKADESADASCSRPAESKPPRVLLAVLAKQKEAVLPFYLRCLEALDYPKSAISLYIRTNNNTDRTAAILKAWVDRVGSAYANVELDDRDVTDKVEAYGAHEWNPVRFRVLAWIREVSLKKTIAEDCDYYFVVDADNFVRPFTLRALVSLQLPIVSPFLKCTDLKTPFYSNYHYDVDAHGYFKECDEYYWIHQQRLRGIWDVKVVHCTYLLNRAVIDKLAYRDDTDRHEYVIFSESARKQGIPQYFDNREVFGYLTLEDSSARAQLLMGAEVEASLARQKAQLK